MNTTMRMKAISIEQAKPEGGIVFEEVVTVKRIIMTVVALLIFSLMALGLSTANAAGLSGWHSSLSSAQSQARGADKPLIVMIARSDCSACAEMERNLSTPTSRRAWSGAVKVRLEAVHNPQMTARYAAGGTPTTLVFSPRNFSSPVYSYTGVMDRGTIVQVGRSIDSMN